MICSVIWLGSLRSLVGAIRCEAKKEQPAARRERHWFQWFVSHQNIVGPAGARVRSREACGGGKRARWSDSTYTQPVGMMWRIVAHNSFSYGSLENATCALGNCGNQPSKTQRVEGGILMVQSVQLGFSHSLGSATSNEANKSAMVRAEWSITARQAMLRLAQMNYWCFVPENCKQNAQFFSGTGHQNRPNLDKYRQTGDLFLLYCRFPARALQQLSDLDICTWKFQDNFANTAGSETTFSQ